MSFISDAIDLCWHGFRVHPLHPGEKLPLLPGWQEAATDDEDVIADWADQWPTANVGVVTGPKSGVLVIDVDVKDGAPGRRTLEDLAARGRHFPPCPTSRTASGGFHLWFKHRDGLRNCAGISKSGRGIGPGIDVRGDGGFIVGPGSRLVQTDKHGPGVYEWLVPPTEDGFPALPDWAARAIADKPVIRQAFVVRKIGSGAPDASLERIAGFVAASPKGQHNSSIFWGAAEAIRAGNDPETVRARMSDAGIACGHDPRRIERSIRSAIETASGQQGA